MFSVAGAVYHSFWSHMHMRRGADLWIYSNDSIVLARRNFIHAEQSHGYRLNEASSVEHDA